MSKPLVWAHRGASAVAPENTLEAFSLALSRGADGIELDVHLSKDGALIVAHDDTVDRCSNGTGRIVDMTLEELRQLDFSNHITGYSDLRIATLSEVYELLAPTSMTVNVEIKSGTVLYEGIEYECLKAAEEWGMKHRVCYSSFNHYSLLILAMIDAEVKIAPLYQEALVEPWNYGKQIGAWALHPYYPTMATPGMMEGLAKAGIVCNPWTVNDEQSLLWMAELGVHAVITDKPDLARQVFDRVKSEG